jgi:hypothetical protein
MNGVAESIGGGAAFAAADAEPDADADGAALATATTDADADALANGTSTARAGSSLALSLWHAAGLTPSTAAKAVSHASRDLDIAAHHTMWRMSATLDAESLRTMSTEALLAHARAAVANLGDYRVRLVKQERVKGKVLPPQTLEATVRARPPAIRIEFRAGPAAGRKLLYNAALRPGEMRVREPGLLGMAGALWIGLDNPLARGDTNRRVTDLGFAPFIDLLARDFELARPAGGHTQRDAGLDASGRWVVTFVAPTGARGLSAETAKLTIDLALGMPIVLESRDANGLVESYRYELLDQQLNLKDEVFTPEGAGL